jgi:NAD(P)-dependent dehydrogenase (short-subunit alcohol dehydrogenase family)
VHARWGAEQRAAVLCRSTPPASIHRAVLTAPPLRRQLRLTAQQGRQQQQTFSRLRTRRTMRSLRSPTISPIPPRARLVRPAPRPRSPRRQVATPCSTGGLPPMNASASSASSLASRDVVAKLQKEAGGGEGPSRLSFVLMDLGDLASVRKAASELLERPLKGPGNTIAALMCNAAIVQVAKQKLTVDGLESQLGVNYMGHFLLCGLLFERLAACEARIVVVGSNGYKMGSKKINFDDLNWDHTYDPMAAYNQSKLAQTMFAFELQRRIQAAGKRHPAVFMCHPGASSTQLCKEEAGWFTSFLVRALMASPLFQSAEKGSWPEVMCATEASLCGTEPKMYGPTGSLDWKGPVGVCPLEEHALDREAAAALWTISEAKTGFKWHQI